MVDYATLPENEPSFFGIVMTYVFLTDLPSVDASK